MSLQEHPVMEFRSLGQVMTTLGTSKTKLITVIDRQEEKDAFWFSRVESQQEILLTLESVSQSRSLQTT